VVITEVYGGGGNSGAPYTNDFIELTNNSSSPVDVTGWSIQYASAARHLLGEQDQPDRKHRPGRRLPGSGRIRRRQRPAGADP
jgi:hypothetical protein